MLKTVEIGDAQATLSEIIASLQPGDEVVIMHGQTPKYKLPSSFREFISKAVDISRPLPSGISNRI